MMRTPQIGDETPRSTGSPRADALDQRGLSQRSSSTIAKSHKGRALAGG